MNIRTYAALSNGVNIFLAALLAWAIWEADSNQDKAALDREVLIRGKGVADSIAAHWENESKAEHQRWVKSDERHKHEMDSSSKARKPMIARERSQRPNPEIKTLVDTIYLSFENDLLKAKEQRKTDSLSHVKELETLQQSKLAIKEYADSTFTQLLTTNDKLIVSEKKLTRMEKIAKALGISTATLAVVVAVLAIVL